MKLAMKRAAVAAAILAFGAVSYGAGQAQANSPVNSMQGAADLMVKARALLESVAVRRGYGNLQAARASLDTAIAETEAAVAANGG